jgi:hypothetical protein
VFFIRLRVLVIFTASLTINPQSAKRMGHSHDNIINRIAAFNNSIAAHLPALEK